MRTEDIVELTNALRAESADREKSYDALERAYGGGLLAERQRYGAFPLTPQDTKPNHISSEIGTDDEVVVNRVRSMIETTRAYIGQLPNLYAPPKGSSEEDMKLAERFERACYGLWDAWVMPRRMSDLGFYCSLLGTSIGILWPDVQRKLPRLLIRSPRGCYPVPKDQDGYELAYAIMYTKEPGRKAAKMLGKKSLASETDVEIIQYIDDKDFNTIANGERVDNVSHKLGFCPVLCIPNIGIPGSCFGESTAVLAVTLQKYLNYLTSLFFATAEEQFSQPIVLPDGSRWPEGLPHGPRDVIELPEGATQQAYRLPPPALPFDVFKIRDTLTEEMSMVTDIPQAMLGGSTSSYLSGRSVNAQLGPVQALMNVRMETIFPAIRKVMWMAFKMMEVMWPNEKHSLSGTRDVWGRAERAPFTETFTVEDFAGHYECLVMMPSGVYFDQQAAHMEMLQDMQNQTLSKETFMQLSPYIRPGMLDTEKQRIVREVEQNVQQNLTAQAQAESLATQNAPMNEPGKTAYSLEAGFMGEVPPAPVPGGMEVRPQSSPVSGQSGEINGQIDPVIAQMVDLLRSVPKVKGRVWLHGDFLVARDYPEGQTPTVEIAVENAADKQTIINYAKAQVPDIYGSMQFSVGEPEPPRIEVTPGTSGYEVEDENQGAEVAPEEEGGVPAQPLPEAGQEEEAIAAMMGAA